MNQDYNNYNDYYQTPQQTYQQPQQTYQQPQQTYYAPQQSAPTVNKTSNGVGVAALVCGIICFFCNPFYLVCLAAVILGIVGLCQAGKPKGAAIAGLILGIAGTITQVIIDFLLSIFTMGISFFI